MAAAISSQMFTSLLEVLHLEKVRSVALFLRILLEVIIALPGASFSQYRDWDLYLIYIIKTNLLERQQGVQFIDATEEFALCVNLWDKTS